MNLKYLVLLLVCHITKAENCQDPNNKPGECKPISQCPPLLTLVQKRPMSELNANFLRKSVCGYVGRYPKVCCSLNTVTTTNAPVVEGPTEDIDVQVSKTSLLPENCGIHAQDRIYGGTKTDLDEFPWMALLAYRRANGKKDFLCGGAIISKRYVLTAAHCVSSSKLRSLTLVEVRLGEYKISSAEDCISNDFGTDCAPRPQDIAVEKVIVHEGYEGNKNNHHDIALLRLQQDIKFSKYVGPICLPFSPQELKKTYVGQKLFVAGWGDTENLRTRASDVKLKVRLPVWDRARCNQIYSNLTKGAVTVTANQLCAGGEGGRDSCKGDSGGPLMTLGKDETGEIQWFVAGVVSYGPSACGTSDLPGVYTRVAKYVPWVVKQLKP